MCYQGKCLICFPVKTGCLVLAILSAIGTGLVVLASLISGVVLGQGAIFANRTGGIVGGLLNLVGGAAGLATTVLGITSLIAFIFCVLLCNGICKRRPGQVMAYFIYGVTVTVLWLMVALPCAIFLPGLAIIVLFDCAIYSLFLRLVHQTYFLLLEEEASKYNIPHAGMQPQRPTYPPHV